MTPAAINTAPTAEIGDVRFRYRDDAPFELSVPGLTFPAGTVVACVGPSGSGKSTLLDLIAGRLVPNTGEIRIADRVVSVMSPGKRRAFRLTHIGMIAQTLELVGHLTTLENILLVATIAHHRPKPVEHAKELCDRLGVAHLLRRKPRHLSQGERQRVAICRALLLRPPVLLCDEPTGSLDPDRSRAIVALLADCARSQGATVLMTTHDHSLLDLVDRVIRVEASGRVVEDTEGSP